MPSDASFGDALEALRSGLVVAAATESSFGLLADCARASALDALFDLKPREQNRGVPLLVPNRDAWATLVEAIPETARRLAEHFWPGALTIALAARDTVDPRVTRAGTVAVRVPGPSPAADLVAALGRPITATSANRPAEPAAMSSAAALSEFASSPGRGRLYVLGDTAPGNAPSTLVSVDRSGSVVIVREGAISQASIDAVLAGGPA